jgi:hypothetical protein
MAHNQLNEGWVWKTGKQLEYVQNLFALAKGCSCLGLGFISLSFLSLLWADAIQFLIMEH